MVDDRRGVGNRLISVMNHEETDLFLLRLKDFGKNYRPPPRTLFRPVIPFPNLLIGLLCTPIKFHNVSYKKQKTNKYGYEGEVTYDLTY